MSDPKEKPLEPPAPLTNTDALDPSEQPAPLPKVRTRADVEAALAALPGDYKDPDYVVKAMSAHFGDLFTEIDENTVRELVKAPETAASKAAAKKAAAAPAKKSSAAKPKAATPAANAAAVKALTDEDKVQVRCTLPNASSNINGIAFTETKVRNGTVMVSDTITGAQAKQFLAVTGYSIHVEEAAE